MKIGPDAGLIDAGIASLAKKRVVRAVGLEPTILAEPDFESGASTNFTTPADVHRYSD